jgi:hypothetical protein
MMAGYVILLDETKNRREVLWGTYLENREDTGYTLQGLEMYGIYSGLLSCE